MIILGISGKRGSGKSLLATNLEPYGFTRLSLARWLKDFCKVQFGLSEEQVNGHLKETATQYFRTDGSPLTPRDIMIRTGIYFRSVDPLFFCRRVSDHFVTNPTGKFVIDDIRFLNEIDYFGRMGAHFARLERAQELNIYKAALDDLSETELDTYKRWNYKLSEFENRTVHDMESFAHKIHMGTISAAEHAA